MEGQVKQQSLNRTVSAESTCRLQWEGALEAGNQQDLRSVSAQDLDVIPWFRRRSNQIGVQMICVSSVSFWVALTKLILLRFHLSPVVASLFATPRQKPSGWNAAISSRFGTSKWSNEKNIRRIPVVKLRVHVGREASTIKVHTLDILEYKSQLQDAWSNIIRLENIAANTMQTPLRLTRNLVVCHNGVGIHHPTITIWLSECTDARLPWVTACCALARSPTAFPEESR